MKIEEFVKQLNDIYFSYETAYENNTKIDNIEIKECPQDKCIVRPNQKTEAVPYEHFRLFDLLNPLIDKLKQLLLDEELIEPDQFYKLYMSFYAFPIASFEKKPDSFALAFIEKYKKACAEVLKHNFDFIIKLNEVVEKFAGDEIATLNKAAAKISGTNNIHIFVRPIWTPAIAVACTNGFDAEILRSLAMKHKIDVSRGYSFAMEDGHPHQHRFDLKNPDQITDAFLREANSYIRNTASPVAEKEEKKIAGNSSLKLFATNSSSAPVKELEGLKISNDANRPKSP